MSTGLRLRFSVHALRQLEEALAYIANDDPTAAARLGRRIEKRLLSLKEHPESGRLVPEIASPHHREVIVAPQPGQAGTKQGR